jgi:hypothetical protein
LSDDGAIFIRIYLFFTYADDVNARVEPNPGWVTDPTVARFFAEGLKRATQTSH